MKKIKDTISDNDIIKTSVNVSFLYRVVILSFYDGYKNNLSLYKQLKH